MSHDDDDDDCDCQVCTARRALQGQIDAVHQQNVAMGAANCRREFWMSVFLKRVELSTPAQSAKIANESVIEFDKAFPEVKTAAMAEDR